MSGFFKHIPDILYDFKSDGKFIVAKDLFRKVSTWSYLQEGVSGYSFYRVNEGERPDVVASKMYGDPTLYWLFFLVNENLQDLNDWPKSNSLFVKFMNRKYPGTCLVASNSTDIVSYNHDTNTSSKFTLGEKVSQSTDIYGFVTDVNPTHNRITLNSVTGIFTNGGTATAADSGKSFTISSVVDEKDAAHHYTDSNDFRTTVSTDNTVVTNEKYELSVNEDKHLIRYIEPHYVSRVTREFKNLVRD